MEWFDHNHNGSESQKTGLCGTTGVFHKAKLLKNIALMFYSLKASKNEKHANRYHRLQKIKKHIFPDCLSGLSVSRAARWYLKCVHLMTCHFNRGLYECVKV
jgi:hypothetical protein